MCWSAEASLSTYLAAMTAAAITYGKSDIWWLLFTFSQVQLAELIMWKDMPHNQFGSLLASLSLTLQPVASIYLIKDVALRNKLWILYGIFIAVVALTGNPAYRAVKGQNGHLKWLFSSDLKNPRELIHFLIWLAFLFAPLIITKRTPELLFFIITLFSSLYFFVKYETWGTMWCWVSIIGWLLLLFR
jgi:hypothetical protein